MNRIAQGYSSRRVRFWRLAAFDRKLSPLSIRNPRSAYPRISNRTSPKRPLVAGCGKSTLKESWLESANKWVMSNSAADPSSPPEPNGWSFSPTVESAPICSRTTHTRSCASSPVGRLKWRRKDARPRALRSGPPSRGKSAQSIGSCTRAGIPGAGGSNCQGPRRRMTWREGIGWHALSAAKGVVG